MLGQVVAGAHFGLGLGVGFLAELCATTLIDHVDAVFGEVAVGEYVALGAFGDGHYALGFAQGGVELAAIEEDVDGVVVFGMAQEDEVVDGDDAWDAGSAESDWQLSRQAVEELDAIALQVVDDAAGAPESLSEAFRE